LGNEGHFVINLVFEGERIETLISVDECPDLFREEALLLSVRLALEGGLVHDLGHVDLPSVLVPCVLLTRKVNIESGVLGDDERVEQPLHHSGRLPRERIVVALLEVDEVVLLILQQYKFLVQQIFHFQAISET